MRKVEARAFRGVDCRVIAVLRKFRTAREIHFDAAFQINRAALVGGTTADFRVTGDVQRTVVRLHVHGSAVLLGGAGVDDAVLTAFVVLNRKRLALAVNRAAYAVRTGNGAVIKAGAGNSGRGIPVATLTVQRAAVVVGRAVLHCTAGDFHCFGLRVHRAAVAVTVIGSGGFTSGKRCVGNRCFNPVVSL